MVLNYESLAKAITKHRNLLNGMDSSGNFSNTYNNLKFLRYYLVLYYASASPLYSREEWVEYDGRGFGLYKLAKIAKQLGLHYDRTKIAPQILLDGRKRGEIEVFLANDSHRYYTITEKGKKLCDDILKEIGLLDLGMALITDVKLSNGLAKYFRSYDS